MPHHTRNLIIALTAFILLALAATAHALPELLPTTGANKTFKNKGIGTQVFEFLSGTKVECKPASGEGGFESDTSGTFHIELKECMSGGFECKTPADGRAGVILFEGSFHFVYDTLGTGEGLGVAALLALHDAEFECVGGLLIIKFKGTGLCLIKTPLTSTISHAYKCEGTPKGMAKEKKYWNDNGTVVETQLLGSQNGGGFEEFNEQTEASIGTAEASAFMAE